MGGDRTGAKRVQSKYYRFVVKGDIEGYQRSVVNVTGISGTFERKLVATQKLIIRWCTSKVMDLGEQSTDEGKSSKEAGLDSKTHSTTTASGTIAPSRRGRRSATETHGSARGG